jgi:anaerobic selenocysteine-containing dehydrogenase
MIFSEYDAATGADRYDVFINEEDARRLNIKEGEPVVLHNKNGTFRGRAKLADVRQGNIEVFWPEGNVLMNVGVYEPEAGVPEYNVSAILEKAEVYDAQKDRSYMERE